MKKFILSLFIIIIHVTFAYAENITKKEINQFIINTNLLVNELLSKIPN